MPMLQKEADAALIQKAAPPALRLAAKVISIIFHPLFIPVYLSWFLISIHPLFAAIGSWAKTVLLLRFFIMYTLFPLVTVLLAKALGFVQSLYLKTQRDRIIPYVACGVYYFWMWYVLRNQSEIPREFVMLSLAIFIAASIGLIANSYLKISMHAMAAGVMAAFVILLSFLSDVPFGIYISLALFIAGLVATARLVNADHRPAEIYLGWAAGIASQVVAYLFIR